VRRIGIFLDLQLSLEVALRVAQEGLLRSHGGPELRGRKRVLRRDGHDGRIGHGDFRVEGGEIEVLLILFGAIMPAREYQNHRVHAL